MRRDSNKKSFENAKNHVLEIVKGQRDFVKILQGKRQGEVKYQRTKGDLNETLNAIDELDYEAYIMKKVNELVSEMKKPKSGKGKRK